MILNFITALAWIWGVVMAIGIVLEFVPTPTFPHPRPYQIVSSFLMGIPAWAWLLARYVI